ncbi:MAG: primosomal protein N', partial [Comamonadaceae bacterium]|nr:primosomal protein N' [Comamonadaceae bacterium]
HSGLSGPLTYACDRPLPAGAIVRVPLGRRDVLGVVWGPAEPPAPALAAQARPIASAFDALPPLDAHWRALIAFAARYYQRALGEVALAALPPQLRTLDATQLARRLARRAKAASTSAPATAPALSSAAPAALALTPEQAAALAQIQTQPGPFLLHGATGSGKTEVYMRAAEAALAHDAAAQVLVMVPEINLTPQLEARFAARFAPRLGAGSVVAMHSGLTPPQRLASWLAAHTGQARIVLGTRMAVLASLPHLRLIVVDEEHDASYKQQEGARYSARDLAVYRGRLHGARVILGSATPSLESWHQSRPPAPAEGDAGGRYQRLSMPSRVGADGRAHAALPRVRRVDMNHQPRGAVLAPPLLEAIQARVARGEQSLLLLNRRGWAPVLHCSACGWKSECPHCSAWRVFHRIDRTLRCHHCGLTQPVPRACPGCGNADITPIGRGTEQLEDHIATMLQDTRRADGSPARVARIDADTTRRKGELAEQLAHVHSGEVDVLVGTQMVTKGHDFRRITLVAAVNPDAALFSSDFRAPERLFALLMQAAGRAGRDAAHGQASEMWVQTAHPAHPLFEALKCHDYAGFAASQLQERAAAGLPPFMHLALLRAESRSQEAAQAFLHAAAAALDDQAAAATDAPPGLAAALAHVSRYPAVPAAMQRLAGVERAQMLLESPTRAALQHVLHALRGQHKGIVRWAIDVDPLGF